MLALKPDEQTHPGLSPYLPATLQKICSDNKINPHADNITIEALQNKMEENLSTLFKEFNDMLDTLSVKSTITEPLKSLSKVAIVLKTFEPSDRTAGKKEVPSTQAFKARVKERVDPKKPDDAYNQDEKITPAKP